MNKNNAKNKKENKILQMLINLAISLFMISSSVKLTILAKPLYYFDIQYLKIEEQSGFDKNEIVENYNYVINYLLSPIEQEFKLPSIPYSKYGQIHFSDVKRIFMALDILFIVTGIISAFGITFNMKRRSFSFIKQVSLMIISLPVILSIPLIISFDRSFIIFHKIFFRNDYWQFDPNRDPIINILPKEFFYQSAIMILILIFCSYLFLNVIYRKIRIQNEM